MIVIGADIHKRTHALAAVVAGTGELVARLEIGADEQGHLRALRWARELDEERVWAIEDCRHVSRRLEQALLTAGEQVVRVAPRLTGPSRRHQRQTGKSDQIDALAVARVVLREGAENLPAAFLDEQAMQIRLLADHRENLITERTRAQNRLRWHLLELCPDLEASLPIRALSSTKHLDHIADQLAADQTVRARLARELIDRIRTLVHDAKTLEHELKQLIQNHRPALLDQPGCGPLTAAILIGRTAGAQRFPTDAHFARMAGVAPIPANSGNSTRHRLHRGGDRQLNRALHIIAITRARTDPQTRDYLNRKRQEGKTNREALRCLKRHLARHIHKALQPQPPHPT